MKKPLLITYEYPPDIGGVGKYLEQEVRGFEDAQNSVIVMRARDYEMSLWPNWLPLIFHVRKCFQSAKRSATLGRGRGPLTPLTGQCDAIWVSHILPVGYIALVYKKLFKIPYRVYLHGLDLVRPRRSFWKSFLVRRILLNADEIIVNSNATAKLLAYYSIPVSVALVKYTSVNFPSCIQSLSRVFRGRGIKGGSRGHYESIGKSLREKYNLENKKILLTISRLVKRKGIDLVIRALPDVWKEIPDLTYVVIGNGEEASHLRAIAKNNPNIIFVGAISDEEKYSWLSACDCFILTPKNDPDDFEGYGIVYKEAQAFGKPVIGSRTGGVPEAISDNGVLIEPDDINEIANAVIKQIKCQ